MLWILNLLLLETSAKLVKSTVPLESDNPAVYLTKFATNIGPNPWSFKARISSGAQEHETTKKHPLTIHLIKDEEWDPEILDCNQPHTHKRITYEIPANGSWGRKHAELLEDTEPRIWFFAISDCQSVLGDVRIRYDLTVKLPDENHLGIEHHGMIGYYVVHIILFLLILLFDVKKLYELYKAKEIIDYSLCALAISIFIQIVALMSHAVNISIVEQEGKHIGGLDFLSALSEFSCQLLVMFIFLFVLDSWSIKFKEFPNPEIYIPLMLMLGSCQFIIAGLGRLSEDAHYKYSIYDGAPIYILTAERLIMLIWFVLKVRYFDTEGLQLYTSLRKYCSFGVVYMLSVPIMYAMCFGIPLHYRYKAIMMGTVLIQLLTSIYLSLLFTMSSKIFKSSIIPDSIIASSPKTHSS
jgi:hypothetical protein